VAIHMNFSSVTRNIALVAIKLGMQTFATQIELGTFFFWNVSSECLYILNGTQI